MRIGFDVDGVLADFNSSFIELVKSVTGRDLFPPNYWPHTWDYPQALGYTEEEVSRVWEHIKAGGTFWQNLSPLRDTETLEKWFHTGPPALDQFHELYFVTSRMGRNVKLQTEIWLDKRLGLGQTVLISSAKGAIAKALKLDFYVDDRAENILDVEQQSPQTLAYLLDQPWNRHLSTKHRIASLAEFLQVVDSHQLVTR